MRACQPGLLPPAIGADAPLLDVLPPPPSAAEASRRQQYPLGLIVNQADNGLIVPVTLVQGHFLLRAQDLRQAGLPAEKLTADWVDVSAMPEVQVHFDAQRQQLQLSVPPAWLPAQAFSHKRHAPRYPAKTSTGMVLNYDVYTARFYNGALRTSAWNEWRLFGDDGFFSHDGMLQRSLSGTTSTRNGYIRYDTAWSNQNEDDALSWTAGDLITGAVSWISSVRLGGVQIARDFALQPYRVTYSLPSFSGSAVVPTTVDMFVNGFKTNSESVQPGPWSLNNLPFVNGAGDAVIVTSDALGRQVVTTLPFYVSSTMLEPGLADFSVSAGALRKGYGTRSADYGEVVASGSYRRGITDWLTLETQAEGADSLALGGVGSQLRLGALGVVNHSWSHSLWQGQQGDQYGFGYRYNNRFFSVGTQHILRNARFGNLAIYDNGDNPLLRDTRWSLSRRSEQYNLPLSLARYGSLGAAYVAIRSAQGERTQLWNLSWSKLLWGDASLFVAGSYTPLQAGCSGALALVVPFGALSNASVGVERSPNGGLSWDVAYARQRRAQDYRQGMLGWRNPLMEIDGGIYGYGAENTVWNDLSGTLVLMDGQVLAANGLNNSFALVKTGYPNVEVSYENQPAGVTNAKGYLLVPGVSAYYPAKYAINTLDLPPDITATQVEQRLTIRQQSGYTVNFGVKKLRAALVILHDGQGQSLPVATQLTRAGQPTDFVGWDGQAWLDNLSEENLITAQTPDGRRCQARLTLPGGEVYALRTYGPVRCPLNEPALGASNE
ncbi:fimbria/pilus outer membrane usher protein [Sodalis praecaptivus]|uniref:fimbria/pilus outer membrane usher protein n=1 Tax=Sodalis praecaptivus TaxID=1239307 RepID=UPI0027FE9EAF|nr:fimbria/pilus outer membrane usher protein [Sodalis praecaptivus]CAJ0999209.1 F1 capsule-anchoring protein [Sodalis praecaptivus]